MAYRFLVLVAAGVFTLASGAVVQAAETDWSKLKDLKSGMEVRVYKSGGKQPVMATLDQATDDALVVVTKDQEIAIPREEIERIDARPKSSGGHPVRETKTTESAPEASGPPTQGRPPGGVSESESTNLSWGGSKGEFKTVYRKTAERK